MATLNLLLLIILLLLTSQCMCISGAWKAQVYQHKPELERKRKEQILATFPSLYGRKLLNLGKKFDDSMNPPFNTLPSSTTPTNPANFPPFTPTPTVVTVPASNPTSVTPMNPPLTTVPTSNNPTMPTTNPANTYPTPITGGNIPTTTPSIPTTNAPAIPGQTWCIARSGAPESSLQEALDYACGIGGADCSMIQEGASCYNPNSIENHASYAFNSYFQRNPVPSSCDFGGAAMLVNMNPSTGTCIYPSSATQVAMPSSTFPPATTSSTSGATGTTGVTGSTSGFPDSGGFISPPSVFNTNPPAASGSPAILGPDSPPTGNPVPAGSATLQPLIAFIILVASFSTGKLILNT